MKKILLFVATTMLCTLISAQGVRQSLDLSNREVSSSASVQNVSTNATTGAVTSAKVKLANLGDRVDGYVVFKGVDLSKYQILALNYSLSERVYKGSVTIMVGNENGEFILPQLSGNEYAYEQPDQAKMYMRFFDLEKLALKGVDLVNAYLVVRISGYAESIIAENLIEDPNFGVTISDAYAATVVDHKFDLMPGVGYYQEDAADRDNAYISMMPSTSIFSSDGAMWFGTGTSFNNGRKFTDLKDFDEIEAVLSCPANNVKGSFIARVHFVDQSNPNDVVGNATVEKLETITFTEQTITWKFNFKAKGLNTHKFAAIKTRGSGTTFQVTLNKFSAKKTDPTTDITYNTPDDDENRLVNVYSLSGVLVRKSVKANEATIGLEKGFYIVGNKKVLVTE
jgi:hypothetical protein